MENNKSQITKFHQWPLGGHCGHSVICDLLCFHKFQYVPHNLSSAQASLPSLASLASHAGLAGPADQIGLASQTVTSAWPVWRAALPEFSDKEKIYIEKIYSFSQNHEYMLFCWWLVSEKQQRRTIDFIQETTQKTNSCNLEENIAMNGFYIKTSREDTLLQWSVSL